VGSTARLTSPEAPPPERPVPAVTPVMSPLAPTSQLTVPSALTARIDDPGAHVPATRRCQLDAGSPPSALALSAIAAVSARSAFAAEPARIAYGTLAIGSRGDSVVPSTVIDKNSAVPSNTVSSSTSVDPRAT